MLYEMVGIVRPGNITEVKEIAMTVGKLVLESGGVIRSISNWGVYELPRPVSRHQMKHTHGHHFVMRYDASIQTHHQIRLTMSKEPRVIHRTHARLGDGKLATLARYGPVDWVAGVPDGSRALYGGRPAGSSSSSSSSSGASDGDGDGWASRESWQAPLGSRDFFAKQQGAQKPEDA